MINLDSILTKTTRMQWKMAIYSRSSIQSFKLIGGYGSGKTNALIKLINEQNDIDKIYSYARDLSMNN